MSKFAFYWCDKDNDRKHVGKERVYFTIQLQSIMKGSQEAETEAEATGGYCLLGCPSGLLSSLSLVPEQPAWGWHHRK